MSKSPLITFSKIKHPFENQHNAIILWFFCFFYPFCVLFLTSRRSILSVKYTFFSIILCSLVFNIHSSKYKLGTTGKYSCNPKGNNRGKNVLIITLYLLCQFLAPKYFYTLGYPLPFRSILFKIQVQRITKDLCPCMLYSLCSKTFKYFFFCPVWKKTHISSLFSPVQ